MNMRTLWIVAVLGASSVAFAEDDIKPADLPAAITAGVARDFPGATIKGAEKEDGVYEVTIQTASGKVEAAYKADGTRTTEADDDGGEHEEHAKPRSK